MAEQTTALAMPINDIMSFGGDTGRMAASFDADTPAGGKQLMRALHNCDARLTEETNMPIRVTDYVIHDAEFLDRDTQEVRQGIRIVLIDADGLCHECCSIGIIRSFKQLCCLKGKPPWNPPKTMIVRMKAKDKRNIFWLECE